MNFSKKTFLLFFILYFLCTVQLCAKTTYYYKMVGKIHNGVRISNVAGGQFITFAGNNSICFESNNKGNSVGNGQLVYNNKYGYNDYYGKSYWGSNTTFRFNDNLSRLNVILENGDVYIFDKTTPPVGVETSTLIRKKSKTEPQVVYPPTPLPITPTPRPIIPLTPTPNKSKGHQCRLCEGKGRKISENYWGQSGSDTKWCDECHKIVGVGHNHQRCDLCDGDGWIEGY